MTSPYTVATPNPPNDRNGFKVAVVCALPLEASMVQATFGKNWSNSGRKYGKAHRDGNFYTTGTIGDHNVVLIHMAEMGGNNAATAAAWLGNSFQGIEVVFLVGICGATPIHPETRKEIILGDCIISTAMIQYDFGRQLPDGFSRKRDPENRLSRPNLELRAMMSKLAIPQNKSYLEERLSYHLESLRRTQPIEYPGPELDRLYNPTYPHEHHNGESACSRCSAYDGSCSLDCATLNCSALELVHRKRLDRHSQPLDQRPKIHFGCIGSANSVMKSGVQRDNLANIDKIVGFEMEGAGLWDVFPTVLLKSVCDYADSHKNKDWQSYAAASSAACLKALLEQWEVSESSVEPSVSVGHTPWMGYSQLSDAPSRTGYTTRELDQWNPNNQARMDSLQMLPRQPISVGRNANFLLGLENPLTAMSTNAHNHQQPNSLADLLNAIDAILKSPEYEDPLTHNSSVRLENTCNWIFDRTFYREWLHSSTQQSTSFLWLHAGAGSGKTILCTSIILSLKADPCLNVFPYFSSAHVQSRENLNSIVRYWIIEAARRDQVVLGLIYKILCQNGLGRMISAADVWILFGHILTYLRGCVFVLDGLDEYDVASRQEFLVNLKAQLAWKGAKVLVTSRDESDIRIELGSSSLGVPGLTFSTYQIARSDTQSDIGFFSNSIVDQKLPKQDTFFRAKLATSLTEKSDGMFLWVKLASQRLNAGQTQAAIGRIVDKAPAGLNSTYEHKWGTIMQQPSEEEKLRAIAILRWCTYAITPLTVAELVEALAVSLTDDSDELDLDELPDEIDEDFVNHGIKGLCGSFVELRTDRPDQPLSEHTVHLIHGSVRDFLLEVLPVKGLQRSSIVSGAADCAQHLELAKICLRYLCYKNVVAQSSDESELSWEFLRYASDNWYNHQAISHEEDSEFIQLAIKFLDEENKNFPSWEPILKVSNRYDRTSEYKAASPFYWAAVLGLASVMTEMHLHMTSSIDRIGGLWGTALQATCVLGHQTACELLLSWEADLHLVSGEYSTALIASVINNQPKMTEILLNHGVNHRQENQYGHTALFLASGWNSMRCARILLEKDPSAVNTTRGKSPLVNAIELGHANIVELLIEFGADVNALDSEGWRPLGHAFFLYDQEICQLLLDHGADPKLSATARMYPVNMAIRCGYLDLAKQLFKRVDEETSFYTDSEGRTLLHDIAKNGDLETFDYFLTNESDMKLRDVHGKSVLEYCCMSGSEELLERVLQMKDMDYISDGSTSIWSPLHWTCREGTFDMIKSLCTAGIVTSQVTTSWANATWSPLDIARFFCNTNLITSDGELNVAYPWESLRDYGIVEIDEHLDESSDSIRGVFKNKLDPASRKVEDWYCDGCNLDIFGPRFRCLDCVNFDYCFMCKHSAEQKDLHQGHKWDYIDSEQG